MYLFNLCRVPPTRSPRGFTLIAICSVSSWVRTRTLYPTARLNALVEETTCSANWCALLGLSRVVLRVLQDFSFQPRHWIFQEFRNKVSLFLRVKHCVRLSTYCSAGVKKGLFIFVCEFVHYVPARRKNAISILSAYSNTFTAFWPFRFPGLRSARI